MRVILRLVLRGFRDLTLNPWAQALTFAAVTLVAFLGGLFLLFLHNLDAELQRVRGDVVYQVYWQNDAPLFEVREQWQKMERMEHVASFESFTPEQALNALAEKLGRDMDLNWLRNQGMLPPTALIAFTPPEDVSATWGEDTRKKLLAMNGVATVHQNTLGSDIAGSWARASKRFVWPLVLFLALVLALVVGNTIKLSLLSRKEEIEILRLVGARNWYIRLPLIVAGVTHGLAGSLLALVLLKIVQASFADYLNVPPLMLELRFLPLSQSLLLVFSLTAVALGSSVAAVRAERKSLPKPL